MNVRLRTRLILVLSVIIFAEPGLCLSEGAHLAHTKISTHAAEIRAAYAACEKFSKAIEKEKGHGDLGEFLSDIDNYHVTIERDGNGYRISFVPLPYEGEQLSGGSAAYHVNGKTYDVDREEHIK